MSNNSDPLTVILQKELRVNIKSKWMLLQPSETEFKRAGKAEITHYNLSGHWSYWY